MRHEIVLEGPAHRLRPVTDADADFIVRLRNDAQRARFLHAGATTRAQQLQWLSEYYRRAGDYYFVIERCSDAAPQGLIALYDLDPQRNDALWGRWIVLPGSLCAVESVWLIHRVAFEVLRLDSDYSLTVADNASVLSFHDSCGGMIKTRRPGYFRLHGRECDAIEHRLLRSAWPEIDSRLGRQAVLIAQRLARTA